MAADPETPAIPAAMTDLPPTDATEPNSGEQAVNRTTHDVDADDMFNPMGG